MNTRAYPSSTPEDGIDLRNPGRKQLRGLFYLQREGSRHPFSECGFDLKADCSRGGHRSVFVLCSPIAAGCCQTAFDPLLVQNLLTDCNESAYSL